MSERSEYTSKLGNPTSNRATGRILLKGLVFDFSFPEVNEKWFLVNYSHLELKYKLDL